MQYRALNNWLTTQSTAKRSLRPQAQSMKPSLLTTIIRSLVGDAEPFEDGGCDRYLIAVRQMAHQRHCDLLVADLLPEVVERHQEERSERVRLSLDLAVL